MNETHLDLASGPVSPDVSEVNLFDSDLPVMTLLYHATRADDDWTDRAQGYTDGYKEGMEAGRQAEREQEALQHCRQHMGSAHQGFQFLETVSACQRSAQLEFLLKLKDHDDSQPRPSVQELIAVRGMLK